MTINLELEMLEAAFQEDVRQCHKWIKTGQLVSCSECGAVQTPDGEIYSTGLNIERSCVWPVLREWGKVT